MRQQHHRHAANTRWAYVRMGIGTLATFALSVLVLMEAPVTAQTALVTELVNVNTAGQRASGGESISPALSRTGLIVTFASTATNLVAGDTNGSRDVFVRYRGVPQTIRASVSSSGAQGNNFSNRPSMDQFAEYVTFDSVASNLVAGDTNSFQDIFARKLPDGPTTRLNVSNTGAQANAPSIDPNINAGGSHVVFPSQASNLVPGDTNGVRDVFVRRLPAGPTTRISVSSSGAQGNGDSERPSTTGRYVVFQSRASNLVPGDTNGVSDVFAHDTETGITTRLSVTSGDAQGNGDSRDPSISGTTVAFTSQASNLVPGDTNGQQDVFFRRVTTGPTTRVSVSSTGLQGNQTSFHPAVGGSGQFIAFASVATNLVPGDTNLQSDVFRHDRITGQTERWSVASGGAQATGGGSAEPAITAGGHNIAYFSGANNLTPGDTANTIDIFLTTRP